MNAGPADGDLVFVVARGEGRLDASVRAAEVARIGSAAADCLARAIARAVYAAELQAVPTEPAQPPTA